MKFWVRFLVISVLGSRKMKRKFSSFEKQSEDSSDDSMEEYDDEVLINWIFKIETLLEYLTRNGDETMDLVGVEE